MVKIPLAAILSAQIIVSLIGVAVIVAVFAVMNSDAMTNAANDAVQCSIKYANELVAGPFRVVVPQIKAMAESLEISDILCSRFPGFAENQGLRSLVTTIAPVVLSNDQYFAVYQTYRLPWLVGGAPALAGVTYNQEDYSWTDCGCLYDSPNICIVGGEVEVGTAAGPNVTGWNVLLMPESRQQANYSFVDGVAVESGEFVYTKTIMTLTSAQRNGVWGRPDAYPLVTTNTLIRYVTFHVPIIFDPLTDRCVLSQNADFNLDWLADFLRGMNIPATQSILIDRRDGGDVVLATSFDIPAFRIPNASEPLVGFYWTSTQTPSPILNEVSTRVLDAVGGSFAGVGESIVLPGDTHFVGAGPVDIEGLSLVTMIVTDNDYYYAARDKALLTAILVGIAVFAALSICTIVTVLLTVRPLQDISHRLRSTARLQYGKDIESLSAFSEIRTLQKAYGQMNVAVQSFVRYVPKDVVIDLLNMGKLCRISMEPVECTVMFADIVSFTSICERVPPNELSSLVLQYFNLTSAIVMRHAGLIDKFIGDCIMAVWGVPFPVIAHDAKAMMCALALVRETLVDPLRSSFQAAGEQLRIRIGVNTGTVLAGNMGSVDRMNYTVIGDAVNLAARLESLGKQVGARILLSEATLAAYHRAFCARFVAPIHVVGKNEAVRVYELIGMTPSVDFTLFPGENTKHTDRYHHCGRSESQGDTASTYSAFSAASDDPIEMLSTPRSARTVPRGAASQHKIMSAATLAHELCSHREVPVTVSDDMQHRVTRCNDAVNKYLHRDFAGALSVLSALETQATVHPLAANETGIKRDDVLPGAGDDRAANLLSRWCQEALAGALPANWDGSWKAEGK
jgi:class 3 adenylate cyclase